MPSRQLLRTLAQSIEAQCDRLLGTDLAALEAARSLLGVLDDSATIALLEELCSGPLVTRGRQEGAAAAARHRLRVLERAGAAQRKPLAWIAQPVSFQAASGYFNRLAFVGAIYNRPVWGEFKPGGVKKVEATDRDAHFTDRLDIDAALSALSDPSRRLVFERLVVRPSRTGEIADSIDISRPAVSHHVAILIQAGLVVQSEARMLSVVVEHLPTLRSYFDRLWIEATLGDAWLMRRAASIANGGANRS